MKELTFKLFDCNFPLEKCLQKPVGDAKESLAVEHYKNLLQIRHVDRRDQNNIYGRLCKLRKEGKPTVGVEVSLNETTIEEDVIEASCFRYCIDSKILLIQQNQYVGASLNGLLLKVLRKAQETENQEHKITADDGISPTPETEVLKKLKERRSLIKKVKIYLPERVRLSMAKDEDEFLSADEKNYAERKEMTLVMKISDGEAKKSTLEHIAQIYFEQKITDASFEIDGEPSLSLASCFKRVKITFDDEKYGKLREYVAIYESLAKAKISLD